MKWKIEPRPGVEVYVSDAGYICLKQEDPQHCEGESCILLDPSIVHQVIDHLKAAMDEYVVEVDQVNS